MKKMLTFVLAAAIGVVAFAQDTTSEMLKKKELFNKIDLYQAQSIFSDRAANEALIKDYETNAKSYKDNQLVPVAVCYLAAGQYDKAEALLSKYIKTDPKSARVMRMLGTVNFVNRKQGDERGNEAKIQKAVDFYKMAFKSGDESAAKSVASAYVMTGKIDKVSEVLPALKKMSKDDMESLVLVLIYSLRDAENNDDALLKEVLSKVDAPKVLQTANAESLQTILRMYVAKRSIWPENALVLPGRAATFAEAWPIAMDIYKKALKADPKNVLALRGMSLVCYRTGGIPEAVDYIKKAIAAGEKNAASDGVEIFLLTGDEKIWNEFKSMLPKIRISQVVRVGMIQYAEVRDNADVFFAACEGDGSDLIFNERRLDKIVWDGLKKFESDKRAAGVKERWTKAGGTEASVKKIEALIEASKNKGKKPSEKGEVEKSLDDINTALDKALKK